MNFSEFIDNWPESRKDQFSYDGMQALFNYLEEYEESTGDKVEYDPIALCCEYREYDSFADFQKEYPDIKDFEELADHTQVIEVDNAMKTDQFIIQRF